MKKSILKTLARIAAGLSWMGSGCGLLKLMGIILAGKLTDEYAAEHPVKAVIYAIGGILIIVTAPLVFLWELIWTVEDKIEKKIDKMRDDSKHIEINESVDEFDK